MNKFPFPDIGTWSQIPYKRLKILIYIHNQRYTRNSILEHYHNSIFYRFLPTKKNIIAWRLERDVRKTFMKLIEHRRKRLYCRDDHDIQTEDGPKDLLEVMIKTSSTNPNICSLSTGIINIDEIIDECKTIFFAAKYSTSNMLTWTTILLAMNPHWQELARDEVFKVCGARDAPSKDDIPKLSTVSTHKLRQLHSLYILVTSKTFTRITLLYLPC